MGKLSFVAIMLCSFTTTANSFELPTPSIEGSCSPHRASWLITVDVAGIVFQNKTHVYKFYHQKAGRPMFEGPKAVLMTEDDMSGPISFSMPGVAKNDSVLVMTYWSDPLAGESLENSIIIDCKK